MDKHREILHILEAAEPSVFQKWTAESDAVLEALRPHFQMEAWGGLEGLEIATREILADPTTESTPKVLEKLAALIVACEDWSWHHSVCHNFDHYGRDGSDGASFLNDPRYFPAATILVDEAVRREDHENCFGRISGPIATYNLDAILANGIQDQFAFKPESLNVPNLQAMKEGEYNGFWVRFIQSADPQKFIQSLKDNPPMNLDNHLEPLVLIIDKEFGRYAVRAFLEKTLEVEDSGRLAENMQQSGGDAWVEFALANAEASIRQKKGDVLPGVYIDVEGTLLGNPPLADYVTYLLDKGAPVTVFTGGDREKFSAELSSEGVDRRVLPVGSKKDYDGKLLDILIDNTMPCYQPFGAVHHIFPFYKPRGKDEAVNAFDDGDKFPPVLEKRWGRPPMAPRKPQATNGDALHHGLQKLTS